MRGATIEVKCENKQCGVLFDARVADRKRGWGKFCSKSCKAIKQESRTGQMRKYLDGIANDEKFGGNYIFGAAEDNK